MERNTIEKMLNFFKEKEGHELPETWFDLLKKLELIKELETHPDGTQYSYEGDLKLGGTNITKLPNDLYVDGKLYLTNCKQLTDLPSDLYVGKGLSIYGCAQLTKLPDNLYVGGRFTLDNTNIANIPDNLYVEDNIFIYDTPLVWKYTDKQIREIVASTGGQIKGDIIRF
jgi:hypothetical protein